MSSTPIIAIAGRPSVSVNKSTGVLVISPVGGTGSAAADVTPEALGIYVGETQPGSMLTYAQWLVLRTGYWAWWQTGTISSSTTIRCTSGELIQATVADGVVDWGTVPTTTSEISSVRCASGELIQAVITDGVVDWITVTDTGGGATTIKATTGETLQATITGGYIEWSTV